MPAQRADARRNHARLLAIAEAEVAAHGAEASLEQIARRAGLGSATVRRHFPGRRALLEAVFRERIEALCLRAGELTDAADARSALLTWLGAVIAHAASARGMAAALTPDAVAAQESECAAKLTEAGEPLVRRAVRDGAVASGVTAADLLTLITGIALATEHHADRAAEADRLLRLTMAGISPPGSAIDRASSPAGAHR
ncbi:AcrR family transcriptional regulator [Actinoalloteichus hoggarensis]|uniref:Transcriptional regulator, TetR family n=1 Tax=Actinoalloteichus hoggarensis TaxID=1470176 RepID=A0A221W4S7_9PSEU|nr:TetR/AcrR family transcriptional regulator [Actinoalloteichus hoggarensis]ASO20900.1 Transcriptional regulator, TetR family [Actinoalloteichus hoggarensis]MBB5920831.1 AcrR family transcriptional regulator [Actinoalloteichus hoggarensis]